jgi:hypothetical protein
MDEKENELSKAQELANHVFIMAWPAILLAATQWTLTTWLAQWRYAKRRGKSFWPKLPHKLIILTNDGRAVDADITLRQWGISCQEWGMQWINVDGAVYLERSLLVAEAQWEMADAILVQNDFIVTSTAGSKRQYQFSQPWGVPAKARSFDEGLNAMIARAIGADKQVRPTTAKLGKTYQ